MEIDHVHIIHDPPGVGSWNMAADEYLFSQCGERFTGAVLRLYAWSEPTLSLGHFQASADREQHRASLRCPMVRRATGGGAILHDHELTYSLVVPLQQRWSQQAIDWYDHLHAAVLATLAEFEMHGHLCPHTLTPLGPEPFLCFQRRARGDVLCGEHKLMGSAQRRRRGAMLQHGSLLLGKSACAPELPGVQDFTRQVVTRERIEPIFQKNIFEIIMQNLTQIQYQWSRSDLNEIEIIEKEQFLSTSWLLRR